MILQLGDWAQKQSGQVTLRWGTKIYGVAADPNQFWFEIIQYRMPDGVTAWDGVTQPARRFVVDLQRGWVEFGPDSNFTKQQMMLLSEEDTKQLKEELACT